MLTEFNELLTNPEQYVCAYQDGEIFIDLISPVPGQLKQSWTIEGGSVV
jgi:hypothetical protein